MYREKNEYRGRASRIGGVVLAALACSLPGSADELLIENAHLVDPRAGEIAVGNLLIVDGLIAGRPENVPEDYAGRRIDATGKWVMPALRDMHTHSYGNMGPGQQMEFVGTAETAKRMLYAGVAGFLDLFNAEDAILGLRDQQRSEGRPGADIFAAGPCITATGGHCSEYGVPTRIINSPEDARREIGELAIKRPDVVKVVYHHTPGAMPSIDRDTLVAAIEAASAAGLPTVIHVGSWEDAWHAVDAGATAITHIPRGSVVTTEMARAIAERGTFWIPTMAVHFDYPNFVSGELSEDAMLKRLLAANVRASYAPAEGTSHTPPADLETRQRERIASLAVMVEAGVPIVAGTDSGNTGTVQGYSAHRELRLMVEHGIPVWLVLRSATVTAGELVGRDWGLSDGDEGTILILDASPVDDISATQRISTVIHRGVEIDREALLGEGSQ